MPYVRIIIQLATGELGPMPYVRIIIQLATGELGPNKTLWIT